MNSKPKYILSVLLLLALIFLLLSPTPERKSYKICESKLNQIDKNVCFRQLAFEYKKPDYCENLQGSDPLNAGRQECYIQMANFTGNTSLCFIYNRYDSSAICLRTVAVTFNNSSICEKDNMEKDVCYLAFAVKKSNAETCKRISSTEIRGNCMDEINHGIKYYCRNYEVC